MASPKKDDKKKDKKAPQVDSAEEALKVIRMKYGEGAIIHGDMTVKNIESISTGSMGLDLAIGIGGLPRGRICELFGAEGCGKTTIALETVACAQRHGGRAAYIDVEHALDFQYAQKLGVDVKGLFISQPDSMEEALGIAEILCQSKSFDVLVVDSVAALVPKAELNGEMGEQHIGLQPRIMSQALRKIKGIVNTSHTLALFINQLRQKVGSFMGSPDVTPGGRALKFYASVRIDMRRISAVKDDGADEAPTGHLVRAKVVKNKVAPPFRIAEFEVTYNGMGVNKEAEIIEFGIKCGVLTKSGSWISYGENRLGNGRANTVQFMRDNPGLVAELREQIIKLKAPMPDRSDGDEHTEPEMGD